MRIVIVIITGVLIGYAGSVAYGEVYQWEDDQGVVHFTDNAGTIPARFKHKVRQRESIQGEQSSPVSVPASPSPAVAIPPPKRDPLYGGQAADWWQRRFAVAKNELAAVTQALNAKREALQQAHHAYRVSLGAAQSGGYALNTIGAKRKAYYDLQAELPQFEERVKEAEGKLTALTVEADSAGVPPEAR